MQTNFPSRSTESRVYPVIINPSPTLICPKDTSKDSWILRNEGDSIIYIKYGENCNPVIYTQFYLSSKIRNNRFSN